MSCCDKPTRASSASKEGCCAPTQSCETSKPSCCTPAQQQPQQQQAPPKACCGPACCTEPSETKENCCDSSCCDKASATSKPAGYTKPACCDKVLPEASSVKQQVRADYARVAVASALNADTVAEKFGYTQQDLAAIPQGANMGVSCGNPLALANVKEGEVVVDLGCGRGLDVFLASPKVGPSGKVYGIDMTPEMLAKARENAAKKNITNVEFLAGEIEALPLPDNSADLVISNCVINLVPDKQKAFTEIYRVLKPGGRLAISDILKKKPLPENVRDKVELISTCFVGAMTHAEGVEFLQKAGFKSILISDANVDLNAYKELSEQGAGCCGSASGCGGSSVSFNTFKDIDFNEYTFSGKIFASKE